MQFPSYCFIRNQTQLRLNSSSSTPPKQEPPVDELISSFYVQIVNAEGALDPPTRLRDALASIDRPDNFLQQVSPGAPGVPPVCKVISRREQYQAERARAKEAQARKRAEPKQLEINWTIDPHDLGHRLKQMKTFLAKGRRVDIALFRKKGKRRPTGEDIKLVMDRVTAAIEEGDGTQAKPMDGEPGKQAQIFVKPKESKDG